MYLYVCEVAWSSRPGVLRLIERPPLPWLRADPMRSGSGLRLNEPNTRGHFARGSRDTAQLRPQTGTGGGAEQRRRGGGTCSSRRRLPFVAVVERRWGGSRLYPAGQQYRAGVRIHHARTPQRTVPSGCIPPPARRGGTSSSAKLITWRRFCEDGARKVRSEEHQRGLFSWSFGPLPPGAPSSMVLFAGKEN